MTISTVSDLKAALNGGAGWLHRDYSDAKLNEFISLAEAKFNRLLRVRQMEASFTGTISSGLVTRPADLVAVKAMWSDSNRYPSVEQKSLEYVLQNGSDGSIPLFYAWERSYFRFNTQSGSVAGVYYEQIDGLTDTNTTNWLLAFAPDLYIAAVIAEHAQYAIDPSALEWASKTAGLIDSLNAKDATDRFSGNSLVVRTA